MSLEQNGVPSTKCLIVNTGSVICIPALSYVTRCITDYTFWPYDKHECRIRFGSWSHTGEEINFHLDKKGVRSFLSDLESFENMMFLIFFFL